MRSAFNSWLNERKLGAAFIHPGPERPPKTHRKTYDAHTAGSRHNVVAELVERNQYTEGDDEGNYVLQKIHLTTFSPTYPCLAAYSRAPENKSQKPLSAGYTPVYGGVTHHPATLSLTLQTHISSPPA